MTKLNKGTKKAQGIVDNYNWYIANHGTRGIYDAYKNPSFYKVHAWNDIRDMCARMGGTGLTVLGHNCMKYSAAFKAVEDGVEKLFYFTADNDYVIEI